MQRIEHAKLRLARRIQDLQHMRNAIIFFCHISDAIPYLAPLGNAFVVRIDDEKGSDLLVTLRTCHVLPRIRPLTIETQATLADAVNVAAFFLTNSCTLSGPCPVSVRTSSDIRS